MADAPRGRAPASMITSGRSAAAGRPAPGSSRVRVRAVIDVAVIVAITLGLGLGGIRRPLEVGLTALAIAATREHCIRARTSH